MSDGHTHVAHSARVRTFFALLFDNLGYMTEATDELTVESQWEVREVSIQALVPGSLFRLSPRKCSLVWHCNVLLATQ